MMEASDYTMNRFAKLYGLEYAGMVTSKAEASKIAKNL